MWWRSAAAAWCFTVKCMRLLAWPVITLLALVREVTEEEGSSGMHAAPCCRPERAALHRPAALALTGCRGAESSWCKAVSSCRTPVQGGRGRHWAGLTRRPAHAWAACVVAPPTPAPSAALPALPHRVADKEGSWVAEGPAFFNCGPGRLGWRVLLLRCCPKPRPSCLNDTPPLAW